MANLKKAIELAGVKAYRLVKKTKSEPEKYCTFQRINQLASVSADDEAKQVTETYRVNIFSKSDYETLLESVLKNLTAAGYVINSVDSELYENDTGYYMVPITIQNIKE